MRPLPVCPSPRGDTSHGPVSGASLKRELVCGFALPDTVFPGYLPPGVGDAGILKVETGEGACAPSPSAPPPEAIPPTVQCLGRV
jgi:hypothetical protein